MLKLRSGAVGLAALLVTGCSAGLGATAPSSPAAAPSGSPAAPSPSPSLPPSPAVSPAPSPGDLEATVAAMTDEDKVGQLLVAVVYGQRADSARKENQARYGVGTPVEVVRKYRPGGVILFNWADNVSSAKQVAALTTGLREASETPLMIGVDQENGLVSRLSPLITELPGAMEIGSTGDPANARDAARVTGEELKALGISVDFAPVADVNINPRNPVIGPRAYGSDPRKVAAMVGAAVDGFHDAGVATVAKHFPGHGDTSVDSHTGLPVIKHSPAQWEKLDAPPFREAIERGVDAIMTAHVVMPELDPSGDPATLSHKILTGLLRDKLGFDGVVTTDALDMAGVRKKYGDAEVAVRSILAGADVLLMPPDFPTAYKALLKAVQTGRITEQRLDESVLRILRLKKSRGMFGPIETDPGALKSSEHLRVAKRLKAAAR
ncbi:beta-N-acetylhexosaminidase [Planotetraspora phitsanulokensis]|uniref:beta-N-acetylhexosaminidase n=1 Tax=Planotetraspora phitsanulokensis TaxID=575192 RepID=UPI0019523681|nr:beta-N-acetylhexosaminidase [Planotetraspora phitsanulokensis]